MRGKKGVWVFDMAWGKKVYTHRKPCDAVQHVEVGSHKLGASRFFDMFFCTTFADNGFG